MAENQKNKKKSNKKNKQTHKDEKNRKEYVKHFRIGPNFAALLLNII